MESVVTFHDDNFFKFHVLYACTGDACALEIGRRFVTESGKKEKTEPKIKPRPHCLGNKIPHKMTYGLVSVQGWPLTTGKNNKERQT